MHKWEKAQKMREVLFMKVHLFDSSKRTINQLAQIGDAEGILEFVRRSVDKHPEIDERLRAQGYGSFANILPELEEIFKDC